MLQLWNTRWWCGAVSLQNGAITPPSSPSLPFFGRGSSSSSSSSSFLFRAPRRGPLCLSLSSDQVAVDSEVGIVGDAGGGWAFRRSTQLVEMEYADLSLKDKLGDLGHVRIRQHVNPLSTALSVPAQSPDWKQVFKDPMKPLMVDIGCGSGRFLLWLAKKFPDSKNYLGLEIRKKLVKRAEFWAKELALENIYFMFANATISFEPLMATYPGPLVFVSILCPDPYFKKRHHKRRVLQKQLVDSISRNLAPGGKVFVQSDVLEIADDMRSQFDALSDLFKHVNCIDHNILCDSEGWLLGNPMGIRTEREIHAASEGANIYRRLYEKQPPPSF